MTGPTTHKPINAYHQPNLLVDPNPCLTPDTNLANSISPTHRSTRPPSSPLTLPHTNYSIRPSNTSFPASALFSSIMTYNITSSSQYTSNRGLKAPRIKNLISTYDISFWQETKLASHENGRTTSFHTDSHRLFLSNNPNNTSLDASHNTAGVATCISNAYLRNFSDPTIYPLAPSLSGHALLILLTHRPSAHILALLNLRLLSGDPSARDRQLSDIFENSSFPFPLHHFLVMGGDFNFNEDISDSSHLTPPTIPNSWPAILSRFNLHEIKQDLPTFLSISRPKDPHSPPRIRTSRIDRLYLSLTEAHRSTCTFTPKVLPLKLKAGLNAHIPLSLTVTSIRPAPHHRTNSSIPPWVISHKLFTSTFYDIYNRKLPGPPHTDPAARLEFFKNTLHHTKHRILRINHQTTDKLHQLQVCVKALRLAQLGPLPVNQPSLDGVAFRPTSSTSDKIRLLARSFPYLLRLIHQNADLTWNCTALTSFVNSLYSTAGAIDPCNTPRSLHDVPPLRPYDPAHKPPCLARTLKVLLPSSRARTTHLRDTSDPAFTPNQTALNFHNAPLTNDPVKLGKLISNFWGKIWARPHWPSPHSRRTHITSYLLNYNKTVDRSLILPVTIDVVLQALAHSGDSAVGPDGIPFAAYRALADISGPLLLDIALLLCTQSPTIPGFNHAILLLLPKDDTNLPDHQRPLAINNTDNRILANVFLLCILPAVQILIDPDQKMFLPHRQMTDHIRLFNHLFYTALFDDLDFFILFCDNIKAFDSMHHDFIHAALKKQGFPLWFRNVARNLMSNVLLIPTLSPEARIPFFKGVKQGCPLSPVLFILIYDILITSAPSLKTPPLLAPGWPVLLTTSP